MRFVCSGVVSSASSVDRSMTCCLDLFCFGLGSESLERPPTLCCGFQSCFFVCGCV